MKDWFLNLCLALVSLSIVIGIANRLALTRKPSMAKDVEPISIDSKIEPIQFTREGRRLSLEFERKWTVLFVFQEDLRYRSDHWGRWNQLADSRGADLAVWGIMIPAADSSSSPSREIKFPVLEGVSPAALQERGINVTPMTLLVAQGGNLVNYWVGNLDNNDMWELSLLTNGELNSEASP